MLKQYNTLSTWYPAVLKSDCTSWVRSDAKNACMARHGCRVAPPITSSVIYPLNCPFISPITYLSIRIFSVSVSPATNPGNLSGHLSCFLSGYFPVIRQGNCRVTCLATSIFNPSSQLWSNLQSQDISFLTWPVIVRSRGKLLDWECL